MAAKPRDIFEENDYIKWYYDPELAKDWKNFLKKYKYLFWINSMNIKDREHWVKYIVDKKPNIDHEPLFPQDEDAYAEIQALRRAAYFQMFRAFTEPTPELSLEVQKGEYLRKVLSVFDKLFEDDNVDKAAGLLTGINQVFAETKPEKFHRDLETERFTIFDDDLLPYISCYESVYRSEKQIMGDLTAEVKGLYKKAGYVVSKAKGNLPPDEAKLEIEFMFRLIDDEISAWKSGNRDRALELLAMQKHFLQKHMIHWLPWLCDDVAMQEFKEGIAGKFRGDVRDIQKYKSEIVEMDFYRGVAILLKTLLEHDYKQVEVLEQTAEKLSSEKLKEIFQSYPEIDIKKENYFLIRMEE